MAGHQPIADPDALQRLKAGNSHLVCSPQIKFKLILFGKPGKKRRGALDIVAVPGPGIDDSFFSQRNAGHFEQDGGNDYGTHYSPPAIWRG